MEPGHRLTVLMATSFIGLNAMAAITAVPLRAVVPVSADVPQPANKAIFGEDDRVDLYAVTDPRIRRWADSTCALVSQAQLTELDQGDFLLSTRPLTASYSAFGLGTIPLEPCDDEPFREQPSAAFCTGFVIGEDLIATAGHCINSLTLQNLRFVFGFQMEDATTPVVRFEASQVYRGIEIVAGSLDGSAQDFAVIRVDRSITAPGAVPLPIRQSGMIPVGTAVGTIGHPFGLPAKAAFGQAVVTENDPERNYFVTDIDALGGNSGGPAFNLETGVVEGVMVRSAGPSDVPTIRSNGFGLRFCFRLRPLEDSPFGSSVNKSTEIDVTVHAGQISFDKSAYQCEDLLTLSLLDDDLAGQGATTVVVITNRGDIESVLLQETSTPGIFAGPVAVANVGEASLENAVLEVEHGDLLVATYEDENDGEGPHTAVNTASVDCIPPTIETVALDAVSGAGARITIETDEWVRTAVHVGRSCAEPIVSLHRALAEKHQVTIGGLQQRSTYFVDIEATDAAGNQSYWNNDGDCFTFQTTDARDYFTQDVAATSPALTGHSLTLVPDDSPGGYHPVTVPASDFPTAPGCGEILPLGDNGFVAYDLPDQKTFPFFGQHYGRIYIGSNGYVTFGEGDTSPAPRLDTHFSQPRISALFTDLHPEMKGEVELSLREDGLAVTYNDIPDGAGRLQQCQVELFYDGGIRITWPTIRNPLAIVGISDGLGTPLGFLSSDLTAYTGRGTSPYPALECHAPQARFACQGPHASLPGRSVGMTDALLLTLLLVGLLTGTTRDPHRLRIQG